MKLLLALLALSASAQTVDLSGPWRTTAHDVPANALPATDDSSWATVSLPLGERRIAPGTWLRRTVEVPAGAEQLVLGRLRAYELYFDGVRQTVPDSPGPNLHRLKPGSRKVVIAIRVSWAVPGPNQVAVDKGPYLVAPGATARQTVEDSRLRLLQRQSPFVLLGGVQLTLAIALFVIWIATERRYSALLWAAAYMVYAAHNLLRLSAFPELPATPRFLPALLSLQIALAIVGRDSTRMRLSLWGSYAALLLLLAGVSANTVAWAGPGIQFLTVATVTVGAWKRDRSTRFTGLVVGLYWLIPPSAAVVGRSLVFENASGYWPLLGLLNVPLALSVVLLFLARFSEDRRERSRLNNEFEAARTVQQMLLPETTVRSGDLLMEAVYEPAQEVGGDFHWSRTAADASLLIAVGDVSGKGLKAALQVSVVIGILRNEKSASPAAVLKALNEGLTGHNSGGFVTCCCARFESGGEVTIANAGHPAPYSSGVEVAVEAGLPLGIVAGVEYAETAIRGERFTFVSDGVIEAARPDGELFGFERTREISGQSAREIAEAAQAWGQDDDITVVTVSRSV